MTSHFKLLFKFHFSQQILSKPIFEYLNSVTPNLVSSQASTENHLSTTATFFCPCGWFIRSLLFSPFSSACLYNKKNITWRLEDMNFIFSWQKKTIFYSLAVLVRKILFCHSKIKFISSHPRVISSICTSCAYLCYNKHFF